MPTQMDRKKFIKSSVATGLAVSLAPNLIFGGNSKKKVRIGFIGVGSQGTNLLEVCLSMDDVEVPAICDIDVEHLARAQRLTEKSGRKKPVGYSKSETDYQNMVTRDDLDGVIIATPWVWHTPMAVDTMRAGKYCAPEVWGASSIDEV